MSETEVSSTQGDLGDTRPEYATPLRVNGFNAITRQIQHGYPISPAEREKMLKCCRDVRDDPKCPRRTRLAAVKTLAALDGMNLKDLHHVEKLQHEAGILDLRMRRAEEGKPNDCVAIVAVPVRELPLPEAMRTARKRILESTEN